MKSKHNSWILLFAGIFLMVFSNGRWIIPIAAWLYPIFFIRFMQNKNLWSGFIPVALTLGLVNMFIWRGMIPMPITAYLLVTGLGFQIFAFPYLINRLVTDRIRGFASTLVFPFAFTTMEYLSSLLPKGTWCISPYSQSTNLVLLQLVAVTGPWGLSFLISWFASFTNWAWNQRFIWESIKRGSIIFGSAVALVIFYGSVRLNLFPRNSPTIRTASIVFSRSIDYDLSSCHWDDAKGIGKYSNEVEKNLLDQTRLAASSGAKIILWQESAGFIPKKEEEVFVHDAIQIAKENKIYLLMTLWSIPEIFPGNKIENKLILIDPNGTIQFTYNKSHAAPPEPILEGKRMLPMINTEYGKLGAAICFDAEFQHFILQAGRNDVDIMFIPANDWKAIDPIHSHMAIMRAVENGFALVHPAGHGLSVASDNRGRILSSMDYFSSEEQIMYADVPTKRGFTIYSLIGDLFAWLCVAGLIWTIWAGFPAGKNRRLSPVQEPKLVI